MKYKIWIILFFLIFTDCKYSAAQNILLSDAENSALNFSPRIQSLINEQKAYEERAYAQKTQNSPKLTLDGSYKYITNVTEIKIPIPNTSPIKFGDNSNYSLGPQISWTAWDHGGIDNTFKSMSSLAEAKKNEADAAKIQIILAVRSAYFQVALSKEQTALYSDALKLANIQYEDIKINAAAGTKSLADKLKSHQEVINRIKQLRQAKFETESALKDLYSLIGKNYNEAELESVDSLLNKFDKFSKSKLNEYHPMLTVYLKSAQSMEYSKLAADSLKWPKLQLSLKSSIDYPNGPKPESYNQNTFAASFSWLLFESGATNNKIKENENIKLSYIQRREQAVTDMKRDWAKVTSQLSNLHDQKELNDISVSETEQLAKIIYKTYKSGSISYIEVENANFKAVEAKIQAAKTKVQILMNLALLASMAE